MITYFSFNTLTKVYTNNTVIMQKKKNKFKKNYRMETVSCTTSHPIAGSSGKRMF